MNETKTYPDGSQRVGRPPFPELSPIEEAHARANGEQPNKLKTLAATFPRLGDETKAVVGGAPKDAEPEDKPKRKPGRPRKEAAE